MRAGAHKASRCMWAHSSLLVAQRLPWKESRRILHCGCGPGPPCWSKQNLVLPPCAWCQQSPSRRADSIVCCSQLKIWISAICLSLKMSLFICSTRGRQLPLHWRPRRLDSRLQQHRPLPRFFDVFYICHGRWITSHPSWDKGRVCSSRLQLTRACRECARLDVQLDIHEMSARCHLIII